MIRTPHIRAMLADATRHAEQAEHLTDPVVAVRLLQRAAILAAHAAAELEDEASVAMWPTECAGESSRG